MMCLWYGVHAAGVNDWMHSLLILVLCLCVFGYE